jgi:hypothetical protein
MLDHELRALVSVDPSPDFQARVRSRVAAGTARVGWFGLRAAALGAAAVVVVALTFVFAPTSRNARPITFNEPRVAHAVGRYVPLAETVSLERPAQVHPVSARGTPPVSASPVQLHRGETLALQRLFASSWHTIVTDASEPAHGPIVIPEIVLEPVVMDGPTEGASR